MWISLLWLSWLKDIQETIFLESAEILTDRIRYCTLHSISPRCRASLLAAATLLVRKLVRGGKGKDTSRCVCHGCSATTYPRRKTRLHHHSLQTFCLRHFTPTFLIKLYTPHLALRPAFQSLVCRTAVREPNFFAIRLIVL